MALTATEEAQARQLIDRLASLVALADNEPLIASKLGAQKVSLSDLPVAQSVESDNILLIRQGTTDRTVSFGVIAAAAAGGAMLQANNLSDLLNKPLSFDTIKQAATESYAGVVELATDLETTTGSDSTRATHSRGVAAAILSFFNGKKATQAQVDAGTDDVNYVTSLKLRGGMTSNATSFTSVGPGVSPFVGHIKLPVWLGSFCFVWGFGRVTVPNAIGSTAGQVFSIMPMASVGFMGATILDSSADQTEAAECVARIRWVSQTQVQILATRVLNSNPSGAEQLGITWFLFGRQ